MQQTWISPKQKGQSVGKTSGILYSSFSNRNLHPCRLSHASKYHWIPSYDTHKNGSFNKRE